MPIYEVDVAVNFSLTFGIFTANRSPENFAFEVGDRLNVDGNVLKFGDRSVSLTQEDIANIDGLVDSGRFSLHAGGDHGVIKARIENPITKSTAGLKAAAATAAVEQVFTDTDLLAPGKAELLANPRNVTISGNGNSDINASIIDVQGTDINDKAISEAISISNNLGGETAGTAAFKTVTKITIPAQGGASGTFSFGIGFIFGVKEKIEADSVVINTEFPDGTVLTTPATIDPILNTVSSDQAFDGAKDLTVIIGSPGDVNLN